VAEAVTIPLLNANEPEALIAALHVVEGQAVRAGDPICTLETTKAAADLEAARDGYVVGLRFAEGDTVRAGEVLCYLADVPDWTPPQETASAAGTAEASDAVPDGLRITQPALALAREHGLDLRELPIGPLVTEAMVRARLGQEEPVGDEAASEAFDPTAIIVYGGGGHGKALLDLLRMLGTYRIVGVVDDGLPKGSRVMGFPVLGGAKALAELRDQGVRLAVNAVGGIGNVAVRVKVFQRLARAGFACPAVVHPTAFVEPGARLAAGVQVMPFAYVGSDARVGFGSLVNTGAIVSHDCVLGEYVNISPGAILAGGVRVGDRALIGMGATVNLRVQIGAGARVGNGATVKADVPPNGVVRAGHIWPAD